MKRSKEDHKLWQHEIEVCDKWIPRIREAAALYWSAAKHSVGTPQYDLVDSYIDWAEYEEERLANAIAHKQRILDYLAGKIGPWW